MKGKILSPRDRASQISYLVTYGKFTPEYIERMKPFELKYYLQKTKEAVDSHYEFLANIHGAKKE